MIKNFLIRSEETSDVLHQLTENNLQAVLNIQILLVFSAKSVLDNT